MGTGMRFPYQMTAVIYLTLVYAIPAANTTRCNNDVLILGQRRRRWANIKTSLFQSVVFAGMCTPYPT